MPATMRGNGKLAFDWRYRLVSSSSLAKGPIDSGATRGGERVEPADVVIGAFSSLQALIVASTTLA
jgi:hypothetical protein